MDAERHTKQIGRVTVRWTEYHSPGSRNWVDMDVRVDGAFWRGVTHCGTAVEALNYIRTQVFDTDDARDW